MLINWKSYLSENQGIFVEELKDLLRIPSVSTKPEHAKDVQRAAQWVASRLKQAGIENVSVMETKGHPVVYGERIQDEDKSTMLIYGHFDVQPVEPLELWNTPPFEPQVENRRLYSRGSSDMKGNVLLPIVACEALLQTEGELPINVKFLYEGEEEIGSPSLKEFITNQKVLLACDMVICADGGVGTKANPVITASRRGLCALEVHVQSAATDLHSGMAGGMAPNALHALVHILDSLRDEEGRILVEGFYDDVVPLTEEVRNEIAAYPFDAEGFKIKAGIKGFFGEPEYTPRERNAVRPTLELNGVWGGYQGDGIKTVIPKDAFAKITCRLVANQTPKHVCQLIIDHIQKHAPSEVDVSVKIFDGNSNPYTLPEAHPGILALKATLSDVSDRDPVLVREGATVPVTALFKSVLGVDTITLGASLEHDKPHAPNENYDLDNFERIQTAYCIFLKQLVRNVEAKTAESHLVK